MPVRLPHAFTPITPAEFRELDYFVMGHAFASHRELGRLADETIYQADLAARLLVAGVKVTREFPIQVSFRGFVKSYTIDLLVAGAAGYELKAVTSLAAAHEAQMLNYLFLLESPHGKLVNFRPASVESRFINAPITRAERLTFRVMDSDWRGPPDLRDLVVDLLRDWGTGLEVALYLQAVIHLLGGELAVSEFLPLRRAGVSLGSQRFDLIGPEEDLRITAYEEMPVHFSRHLERLLQLGPLHATHWINVGRGVVTFTTVTH